MSEDNEEKGSRDASPGISTEEDERSRKDRMEDVIKTIATKVATKVTQEILAKTSDDDKIELTKAELN